MRTNIISLTIIVMMIIMVCGCGGGSRMHQTKIKTPGGLPRMVPQVDDPKSGGGVIDITEEMKYPGMTPFEDAIYEFVAGDSPDKVAKWFEANLKDSTLNKRSGQRTEDVKYEIRWEQYIIDIVPGPHGGDSLIRYKKNLDLRK